MEDMRSQVWLEIGTRWFNLATYTELYHEVEEFFRLVMNPVYGTRLYNRDGTINPMTFYNDNLIITPMDFNVLPRVEDYYIEPDLNKWKGWRENVISNPNQQF